MDGTSRSSTVRRVRAHLAHVALAAVIAVAGLVAAPAPASALSSVKPLLDCVVQNGDGSWTAIFGYDNPNESAVTIPVGPKNEFGPKEYGQPQPTSFEPGLHRGVLSITVTGGRDPEWDLDGTKVEARADSTPVCPSSTELPEEGNGTGPAIALAAAGVVGAVLARRANRRARALVTEGHGDA
jgi:hypothetical protein